MQSTGYDAFTIILFFLIMFLVLPAFIFLLIIIKRRRTPEARGKRGEEAVSNVTNRIAVSQGGYTLNDVIIPNGNKSAQIDHLYFSERGIFVIETKNYSGRIYGDEESVYWTQVLAKGRSKYKLYNPLKQNNTHVNALRKLIGRDVKIIPIVVFAKGNTDYIKSNKVFSPDGARRYMNSFPVIMEMSEVEKLYLEVKQIIDNNHIDEEQHKAYVQSKGESAKRSNEQVRRKSRIRKVKKILRRL